MGVGKIDGRRGFARLLAAALLSLFAGAGGTAQAASSTTTIQSSLNPSRVGQSVTFTATVTGPGASDPTGTVTFKDGTTTLGSGALHTTGAGKLVAGGNGHSCAVTSAGGVKCWGANDAGQLGNNSSTDSHVQVDVVGLSSGVSAISAGRFHSCALTDAGAVKCWGGYDSLVPVDVAGLSSGVVALASGWSHDCVVTSAGGAKCWGVNSYGQLGDGSTTHSLSNPVDVTGLTAGVAAVAAGPSHTCALTGAGGVKCWGANFFGQLGNNSSTDSQVPVDVIGLSSSVVAIASTANGNCVVTSAGGVKCWGNNGSGQLGNNSVSYYGSTIPVDVVGLSSGVVALAAAPDGIHNCALTSAGGVKCWGSNAYGQLGDNSTTDRYTPVDVVGLSSGVVAIGSGYAHTCALMNTGAAKCWGQNRWYGQLGNNTTDDSSAPVPVTGFTGLLYGHASFATSALAAGSHSITAEYGGDGTYSASTSAALTQTVNKVGSTVSVGASVSPSLRGQSVTFTATVTPSDATGTVTFTIDGASPPNNVVNMNGNTAQYAVANLSAGDHTIVAVYNGDGKYFGSTSADLGQTVGKGATTLSVSGAPNPSKPGQAILFTATLGVTAPAAGTPAGTVTFKDGAATLGSGAVSSGQASLSTAALTIGTHNVTANYSGDSQFKSSSNTTSVSVSAKLIGADTGSNTFSAGAQQFPAIARFKNGSYFVVWASNGQDGSKFGVYGQRYNADGVKQGGEIHVSTFTAGNQTLPKIAGLTGGNFVAVWQSDGQDGNGSGIFAQAFKANGAKAGKEFRVNTTTVSVQAQPAIAALTNGGFVVAWTSNGQDKSSLGIYAQRYDAKGKPAGAEFKVNKSTAGPQSAPAVAALDAGAFVVVWQGPDANGLGIYAQRYDASGKPAGPELRVNTVTVKDQSLPSATGTNDGGFVVVWQSALQDGSGLGIYMQRFKSTGARNGGELRVNTFTANNQWQPQVAAFADGGFVVLWTSLPQDGSGKGVYAQAFNAAGAKANAEFLVNTTTAKDQWQPAVAAASAGNFMAAWTSRDQDGSLEGVYTERFLVPLN